MEIHPNTVHTSYILVIYPSSLNPQTNFCNNDQKYNKSLVLKDKTMFLCTFIVHCLKKKFFFSTIQFKIPKLLTSKQSNHKKEFSLPEIGSSNRNTSHKQLLKSSMIVLC